MLLTTDEAREYFKPLTYDDLTEKNFNRLVAILTEVLGKWNRHELEFRNKWGHGNNYLMTIHEHKRFGRYPGTRFVNKNGKKEAFIIVKCDNYSYREGISFNKDGFIGFAGWADSDNVRPFLDAFEQWVDILKDENFIVKVKPEETIPIEVYKKWEQSYYVNELPKEAKLGQLVCCKGIEYAYAGEKKGWISLRPAEEKLSHVKEIVKDMEDSPVKTELLKVLV